MWKPLEKNAYRAIFSADSRALLEITVFEVGVDDWQRLLDHLAARFLLIYSEDGVQTPLPKFEIIRQRRNQATLLMEVMLPGFTINCQFSDDGQIQMDLLPEDVNSSEKAEAVFQFMLAIARLLNKRTFLVPEYASADSQRLCEMAICMADPENSSVFSRST